jgi:hypothetical protein
MTASATSDPSARTNTVAPAAAWGSPTFPMLAAVAPPLCAQTPAPGPGDDDDDDDPGRGGGSGGSIDPDEDEDVEDDEDDEDDDDEDDDDEDPLWASRPGAGLGADAAHRPVDDIAVTAAAAALALAARRGGVILRG